MIVVLVASSGWLYVQKISAQMSLQSYKTEVAENTAKAQEAARGKERKMQDEIDKLAQKVQKREKVLASNAVSSQRTVNSLRDKIASLNSRPATQNPQLAACTREAGVARELLGSCSERYSGVARDADELRDQVTGLQEFVNSIK